MCELYFHWRVSSSCGRVTGDGHEVYLYKLQIYLNMQNIIPGEDVFFILKEKPNKSRKNKGD